MLLTFIRHQKKNNYFHFGLLRKSLQMTARLLFITVLTVGVRLTIPCSTKGDSYCYHTNKNPYVQFGPFTRYSVVHGTVKEILNCRAVQLWMMVRDGTHYPDSKYLKRFNKMSDITEQILKNQKAKKVSVCSDDINILSSSYSENPPKNKAGYLTEDGKTELYSLGYYLKYKFLELLYNRKKYVSIGTHLGKESVQYFIKGVEQLEKNSITYMSHEINQNIILTYLDCKKWQEKAQKNKDQFLTSTLMQEVQSKVSNRLGYDKLLDTDSIMTMYDACRLRKAWHFDWTSPWCAVFKMEELKMLEYGVDLYFYYKSGPGNLLLNKKLACPAVKDMIDAFSRRISEPENEYPASFYLTNQVMLDILQVGLEITKPDNSLTPDNYSKQKNREYRTTKTMPFAGNILAVLYACNGGRNMMVAFYQNEVIVQYPGCDNGLCDWEMIKNKFHNYINHKSCTDMKWCDE